MVKFDKTLPLLSFIETKQPNNEVNFKKTAEITP